RPTDGANVRAEHPECGPDALPVGQSNAGREFAEFPPALPLRLEARRRVAAVCMLDGRNDEVAVLDVSVRAGVSFQLVIAPTATAKVISPVAGVDIRPGEFIGPHERPARTRRPRIRSADAE